MAEVIHAARATKRDPSVAPQLWGCTNELCDVLERESASTEPQRAMITAVREDIRAGARDTQELADEIVWFVKAIEHDLCCEERERLADGIVVRDQTDG